jgi:hypothetical protein
MITLHLDSLEEKDGVCTAKDGDVRRKRRFFVNEKKKNLS